MRVLRAFTTSTVRTFAPGAVDCLWNGGRVKDSYSLAGVSSDGSYGWVVQGSALEVFDLPTGQRLAAWNFGAVLKDAKTIVTAVCEYVEHRGTSALFSDQFRTPRR